MIIKQLESEQNLTLRSKQQLHSNPFILILTSLLVALAASYWGWRQVQLNAAYKLVQNCTEQQNCTDNIAVLEQLVKAKKSLKLFNLGSAELEYAHLEKAKLPSANLEQAHLEHAFLEDANLDGANLATTHLRGAHLDRANLKHTNLSHADLENANLYGADLQGARISHDDLQGAHLDHAKLQGTHLYHANFAHAYFHLANLSHAQLYRANFDQANLYRANLEGTHFIEVHNLNPGQIKSACNWDKAIYKWVWSAHQSQWLVDEKANQQFIQQLKEERSSDTKKPVDCRKWN